MKKEQKHLYASLCLLAAFALWTAALRFVDVQPIGPEGTSVGFATLNRFIHALTGVHMSLYVITDWLGLIPLAAAAGFGILGLCQWMQRKTLRKVDADILILGAFYLTVMAAFLFFEHFVINYRPILIEGRLEASYPSSTTMLALCVMPTARMQLRSRIQNLTFRKCVSAAISVFTFFMVIGRLVSGVHWFTDIIGGILLSAGFVLLYHSAVSLIHTKSDL